MRSRLFTATACLLAVACGPVFAQKSSADKPDKPATISGKTLAEWIKESTNGRDPAVREAAVRIMPYFGDSVHTAVPSLLLVLQNDPDVACRVYAALTLSTLPKKSLSDDQVAKVVRLLADKADSDTQLIVRLHAVLALGSYGRRATEAIPVLAKHIRDPNSWELRQAALMSLASVAAGEKGARKTGPDGKAVAAIAKLLAPDDELRTERSSRVRLAAVLALGELGRPDEDDVAEQAARALVKASEDKDTAVAIWALGALMKVDKVTEKRLNELAAHLQGKNVPAKVAALAVLAALDKADAKAHIPDVVKLLDDKDLLVRAAAIDVLAGFAGAAREAVPALRKTMDQKDQVDYFKRAAADALEKITGEKPALPQVPPGTGSSLNSSSSEKRNDPTEIEGKTLEQWIKEIRSPDPSVQELAIQVVPYFGKKSKEAVPALVFRVRDREHGDIACRAHAVLSLSAIAEYLSGVDADTAVKALIAADADGQAIIRYHVVVALGSYGTKATAAIPTLINRIHDPASWELRQAAVSSLGTIASGGDRSAPDGRAVLAIANRLINKEERSAQVRTALVMALGAMGRPALDRERVAVQALIDASNDKDKSVAIWARVALMAVDKVTDKLLGEVVAHFKGKDVAAKVTAARALGAMAKEAKPKIPDVAGLLNDKDPVVLATALDVLAGFGSTARDAGPAVKKFMDKVDDNANIPKEQKGYFKDAAKYTIEQVEGAARK